MENPYEAMSDEMKSHLKRLADEFFENLTIIDIEFGGIGLDPKRPFGNSSVESDILEILNIKPDDNDDEYSNEQRDYARRLYFDELIPFLKNNYSFNQ